MPVNTDTSHCQNRPIFKTSCINSNWHPYQTFLDSSFVCDPWWSGCPTASSLLCSSIELIAEMKVYLYNKPYLYYAEHRWIVDL
jgi:hypothetical protein